MIENVPINCPLIIDLDNTLLQTDTLDETFFDLVRTNPVALWQLPIKGISGIAAIKAFLAQQSPLEVETWPVNTSLIEFVEAEAVKGRKIVLATAADETIARAVAKKFPFINEIISSDGKKNIKGEAKAEVLKSRFPAGFIYAGDAAADLPIWQASNGKILVNTSKALRKRAEHKGNVLNVFPKQPVNFNILRRSLRLHQWAKNLLVFIPLILGGKAGDASAWLYALMGFFSLGLVASATYIINDLWDLPDDRKHWSKRFRPLASGLLSLRVGVMIALVCLISGFALATYLGPAVTGILALYAAVTLSYSFAFKKIPIVDVLVLACLFTIRLGLGIALTTAIFSPWLLVFSMFVFLSLSMAKRHIEVLKLVEKGLEKIPGRGYYASDSPLTIGIGLAAMLGAILIMTIYLIEDAVPSDHYAAPEFLWAMPLILFLFLGRVWLLSQRGEMYDDPVAFALKDRISLLLGSLMGVNVLAAIIGTSWL
jgi:4-hydroxybenzoate polyprenyltransferase